MRIEVHKFGGTSVADADRIRACAEILLGAAGNARVVAVVSAMSGVTNELLRAAELAGAGKESEAAALAEALRKRHVEALAGIGGGDDVAGEIAALVGTLEARLRSVAALRELTPRIRDAIAATGEKLSIRLLAAALAGHGVAASPLDADTFLETDGRHGDASPLHGVADRGVAARLRPLLDAGRLPVVTGFIGQAPDGSTTTLSRGGSDWTATILAAALDAAEVTIWTDIDGVCSAEPGTVPEARPVPHLNFREAAELSYFGAKVLHPRTIQPVAKKGIPVRVRSTFETGLQGTVVDGRFTPGSHPVKALGAVRDQALVSVEGKGMAGVPGAAGRVFTALAREGINVTMISQSSSEASICLATLGRQAAAAEMALKREFRGDLARGDIEEITVRGQVGILAAVGLGMARTPGVAARLCGALAARGVSILAIAQGSSELNISVAVDRAAVDDALRAAHHEFGLDRRDTGDDTVRRFDLLVLGAGHIGRALVRLILARRAQILERFGLEARLVALGDRSGFLLDPRGLDDAVLAGALAAKESGRPLRSVPGATAAADPAAMVRAAAAFRLARPVLIDVSDADTSGDVFLEAFQRGFDVVTANKKPLSGPAEGHRAIVEGARSARRLLKAEATAGAGLPVLDTIEMLLLTGDTIRQVEGCLSGTLAFVLGRLESGARWSESVAEAVDLAYTEPDPADDLSGLDVARKALILGRLAGLVAGDVPLEPTGLVPPGCRGLPWPELRRRLEAEDSAMAARAAKARASGRVLRYVARVGPGRIAIGPEEVPIESPLGRLQGTDNMLVFTTDRYAARPLVITGPGAGVDVTAMGVLGDVLRIAAERR